MDNIEVFGRRLKLESFAGRKVSKFLAVESEFVECSFEDMEIKDICFGGGASQTRYLNCSFDNSVFSSNVAGTARFENCSFKNVTIKKLFCVKVEFVNCVFTGEITKGNFAGVNDGLDGSSTRNEYIGNDFRGLDLKDVGFANVDLTPINGVRSHFLKSASELSILRVPAIKPDAYR
jgi:uncharacterized protein YjbI with pentapeptide repeats